MLELGNASNTDIITIRVQISGCFLQLNPLFIVEELASRRDAGANAY
jgi:hypothetical protein